MPTINGNLILEKDTVFEEDLIVKGNIIGKNGMRYNLRVKGKIDCHNINCSNINASFILCETLKQKEGSKLIAKNLIEHRSTYERKEIKR